MPGILKQRYLLFFCVCGICMIYLKSTFNCYIPREIGEITRLTLGLSQFRENRFKYSFQDMLNPLYDCGFKMETIMQYLLHCPTYQNERLTLRRIIIMKRIDNLDKDDFLITQILLYDDVPLDVLTNTCRYRNHPN